MRIGSYTGLPSFVSRSLQDKFADVHLGDFYPVEVCNLEYTRERGSGIDPHVDDTWIWGQRLVTLNLLSHSCVSFLNGTCAISVPLPQRSLIVVQGPARYQWEHAIDRRHIRKRRVAVTLRELSSEFMAGSQLVAGEKLLNIAY